MAQSQYPLIVHVYMSFLNYNSKLIKNKLRNRELFSNKHHNVVYNWMLMNYKLK